MAERLLMAAQTDIFGNVEAEPVTVEDDGQVIRLLAEPITIEDDGQVVRLLLVDGTSLTFDRSDLIVAMCWSDAQIDLRVLTEQLSPWVEAERIEGALKDALPDRQREAA